MRFVCTSDTHKLHRQGTYPEGDVLIVAGDFTDTGSTKVLGDLNEFFATLSYDHIICVTGNHDVLYEVLEDRMIAEIVDNAIFLDNTGIQLDGINIYGTSFNLRLWRRMSQENGLKYKTDLIPQGTDILISHEPPFGYLDQRTKNASHMGSKLMLQAVQRVKPRYHVFGHIHEAYGRVDADIDGSPVTFLNCAATLMYGQPLREPHIFDFYRD